MALQHVEGTVYKISFVNNDYTNVPITIVGGYSPETVWALAECLLPCVKQIWFNNDPTVRVGAVQATGDTADMENPTP